MDRLSQFRTRLAEKWDPCVAVISSPEADRLCEGPNGLSLVSLLRPFGTIQQLNGSSGVPVRTVGEAPFRLHSWRLRFYASSAMFQPVPEESDLYLQSVLSQAAAAGCKEELPALEELTRDGRSDSTPWYDVYQKEFMRLLAFGEQEAMDHPVACLLVLPSTYSGDFWTGFNELFARPGSLPLLMQQGVMESRIPKHYVMLHDASTAPQGFLERAQQAIHRLSTSGYQCHLLVINSRTSGQPAGLQAQFWAAATSGAIRGGEGAGEPASQPTANTGQAYGAGLSEHDVQSLSEFVRGLAVNHIIPNLEMRVRALNQQVTSNRKGLRNQLKSLLWRKSGPSSILPSATDSPASSAPSTPTFASGQGEHPYPHTSVEGEMRVLSDLSLMLRDYEKALSTLRMLASDFKQDKAWKHYAAVQEALGATIILMGGSNADAVANLKEAFYRYQQVSQSGGRQRADATRYATRTAMMLTDFLRAIGQHGEANQAFMKAHFQEDNVRAGLLLEQAAHCLLRLLPSPHVRKFAFHLVLAGLRYNLCGQKGLALRAYKQVVGVYSGRHWALIEEHLHDVMGRQSREAGDWFSAVTHYMAMTNCPTNPPQSQQAYLAQFLEVLGLAERNLGYGPILELPLPEINLERVGLQYDSQTGYGTPQARQVDGEVWRLLEAAVQPAAEGGPLTWLDGGSRANFAHQQPDHSCVVGEVVGVEVEVFNPLQIDVAVTQLRLVATLEAAAQHSTMTGAIPSAGAGMVLRNAELSNASGLQIREETVTLAANERMVVNLRVVPLRAGSLSIEGVAWTLSGIAQGQAQFRIPRPKPRKIGSSKPQLDAERPPPGGIKFTVLPPLPHLEVSTPTPLPPTLFSGEVVCLPVRLRNTGAMTMSNICLAVNSSTVLLTAVSTSLPAPSTSTGASGDGTGDQDPPQNDAGTGTNSAHRQEQQMSGAIGTNGSIAAVATSSAVLDTSQTTHQTDPNPGAEALAPAERTARQPLGGRSTSVAVSVSSSERPGGVTVFSLNVQDKKLGVGQELQVMLWMRSQTDGIARFNCVWYYEPIVKLDSLRFRTLRATYAAVSQPALSLSAAAIGGRLSPGTCLLQLRVSNQQGVESFRLNSLSCPGNSWQLADLRQQCSGQKGVLDEVVAPEGAATLHVHLTPTGSAAEAGLESCEPSTLADSGGQAVQDAVISWFFWKGHPTRRLRSASSSASLVSSLSQQQQQQQRHEFEEQLPCTARPDLIPSKDQTNELAVPLDLQLSWEVIGSGEPHQFGSLSLYQERVQEGPPVHVQLLGPHVVKHDFTAASFCSIQLLLRLRNMLPCPASISVDVGKLGDGITASGITAWSRSTPLLEHQVMPEPVVGVQSVRQYVWCNRTRISLPELRGFSSAEVPLHVALSHPASLSVGDYVISWSYGNLPTMNGSVVGPPCLVTVQQAGRQGMTS